MAVTGFLILIGAVMVVASVIAVLVISKDK
jgi:hypothetical protein